MMNVILLRGLPGAGKSTLGQLFKYPVLSADDYFLDIDGEYRFEPSEIKQAHDDCYARFLRCLEDGKDVVVANTFTQQWELERYIAAAERVFATVHVAIVENRHGNRSVHGVPLEVIERMKKRFEVQL